MLKSRGAAVVGAFVLIALAIFIRGLVVGDEAGGSDGSKEDRGGTKPVVACSPEVIAVCDALADAGMIKANPPELDLPQAGAPPIDIDGWISWSPASEVANYRHIPNRSAQVWGASTVLGSAAEHVLIDEATRADLAGACPSAPTWSCLAEQASGLSIGVGDPMTAEGLARLAPFASALAEGDDYLTLDAPALDDVVRSAVDGQLDTATGATRLATQPGLLSMVAGPEALLKRQTTTQAGQQRGLRVIEPTPAAKLTLVLTPRTGHEDVLDGLGCKDLPDEVTEAIQAAGLRPCTGSVDDALAGFLYQVQKKVS